MHSCLKACLFISMLKFIHFSKTVPMRDKEIKQDYRFMPEPNLPPLHLYTSDHEDPSKASEVVLIDKIQKEIPVLPEEQRNRLMEQHGITLFEADAIVVSCVLF